MVMGLLPLYFAKTLKKKEAIDRLDLAINELEILNLTQRQMKYKFITICSKSEKAMAISIPVEDEDLKFYIKPRYLIF